MIVADGANSRRALAWLCVLATLSILPNVLEFGRSFSCFSLDQDQHRKASAADDATTSEEQHRALQRSSVKVRFRNREPSRFARLDVGPGSSIKIGADLSIKNRGGSSSSSNLAANSDPFTSNALRSADDTGMSSLNDITQVCILILVPGERQWREFCDASAADFRIDFVPQVTGIYRWRIVATFEDGTSRRSNIRWFRVVVASTPNPTETPTTAAPATPAPTPEPTDAPVASAGLCASQPNQAIVYGLQPSCSTPDTCGFNICLDLRSQSRQFETWMNDFAWAKARWEEIISGDDGAAITILPQYVRLMRALTQTPSVVDDIFITGDEINYDGLGGVLGAARPTLYKCTARNARSCTSWHSFAGLMIFDSADVNHYSRTGRFREIVLHEMGHVLGIGPLWTAYNLVQGFQYRGQNVVREWNNMGCAGGPGFVPLESNGGSGTAGSHWSESCLGTELMTGYLSSRNPLSRLSVATLQDMGYTVDYSKADPFNYRNLWNCGNYCPAAARRHLEDASDEEPFSPKPPLSEAGRKEAIKFGLKILRENQAEEELFHRNLQSEAEDVGSLRSAGSSEVEVMFVEKGHLHHVSVTSDDLLGD